MKIGFDVSQIVYEGTGSARFTAGLLQYIIDNGKSKEWEFFFSSFRRQLPNYFEQQLKKKKFNTTTLTLPPTAIHYLWNKFHYVSINKFIPEVDWFITSDWSQPPSSANIATLVHDLAFIKYPKAVASSLIDAQASRLSWAKRESKIIIASSESTKKDLVELLGFDENKVVVLYPGVDVKIPSEVQVENTLKKYNITKPFVLSVGKLEPRKNLERLIQAFSYLNNTKIDLLLVGPKGWSDISIKQNNVRILGYVNDEDLYSLYRASVCFIFPSIWEGFGYPLVEAMKLDTPTLASNTSSLGEIGKDASLQFDPANVNDMTDKLQQIIESQSLQKEISKKGLEKSKLFTWKAYYKKLISTLSTYK